MALHISSDRKVRIRQRWEHIKPTLIADLKSKHIDSNLFASMMVLYEQTHYDAVVAAMDLGIPMMRIRKYNLDDPRLSESERDAAIKKFLQIQRSYTRCGPSLGRSNLKRPKAILPGDI